MIQAQAATAGKSRAVLEKEREKALRDKAKADDEKAAREAAALLKPVQTQKIAPGVDPKTVLCAFFKAGHCEKGAKCKFSHDLDIGRKVDKRNLYADTREEKMEGDARCLTYSTCCIDDTFADTMDTWDDAKLRDVVLSKHGNPKTTTDVRASK